MIDLLPEYSTSLLRAALLLAAAAQILRNDHRHALRVLVPAVEDEHAGPHVPRGHVEWNYTLQPHMLATNRVPPQKLVVKALPPQHGAGSRS